MTEGKQEDGGLLPPGGTDLAFSERPTQQIKIFDVPGMLQKQGFIYEGATFNRVYSPSHIQHMHRYGDDRMYWMADPVRDISIVYSDDWSKQPWDCWFR